MASLRQPPASLLNKAIAKTVIGIAFQIACEGADMRDTVAGTSANKLPSCAKASAQGVGKGKD